MVRADLVEDGGIFFVHSPIFVVESPLVCITQNSIHLPQNLQEQKAVIDACTGNVWDFHM